NGISKGRWQVMKWPAYRENRSLLVRGAFSLTPALCRWERGDAAAGFGLLGASRANPVARLFSIAFLLSTFVFLAGCGKANAVTSTERKVLGYQCAMHPWIKSDKPGRCTICTMELTPIFEGEAALDGGGDLITLSSNSIRVLNVQTAMVKVQPLAKTLTVAG